MDIHSVPDVFSFVFNSLPNEVTVYPTENYFYFTHSLNYKRFKHIDSHRYSHADSFLIYGATIEVVSTF